MNGLEYRELAKQYRILSRDALALHDLDQIFFLLGEVQHIRSELIKTYQRAFDFWAENENDENFTEIWRLERANNSFKKIEDLLDERYWQKVSIMEARIARKRQEKIDKGII